MVIDGKLVTIFLKTTKKPVEDPSSRPPSSTQPAKTTSSRPPCLKKTADASSSRPPSSKKTTETTGSRPPSVTQSLDEALSDEGPVYNSDDAIVQEVSVEQRAGTDATTAPRSQLLPFWSSSLSWALAVS